jgi:hypothetical protein
MDRHPGRPPSSAHIDVGQRAPDFELPAADREGVVALAEYRGKSPVLLALFRGLKALGLTMPPSLLARTDQVIE